MSIILVRQMFSSWDICGGTQLKHFFYIHFINKQDCVPASRNAGKTSCVRRHSTCSDAVKSTVRAVPLRLFHLFHNTTSYCEAALIQFGRKYSSVLQENYFWLKFATRCGQMQANSCFVSQLCVLGHIHNVECLIIPFSCYEFKKDGESGRMMSCHHVTAVMCLNIHRCAFKRPVFCLCHITTV